MTETTLHYPALVGTVRERLAANRTYYVRKDGSDSNNGLADTAAGAFLTIGKAMSVIGSFIDTGGYTVTIQVRAGTYMENVALPLVVGVTGVGQLKLLGDATGTFTNVSIQGSVSSPPSQNCPWEMNGFRMLGASGRINSIGGYLVVKNVHMAGNPGAHFYAGSYGYLEVLSTTVYVSMAANHLANSETHGTLQMWGTTVNFQAYVAYSITAYVAYFGLAYMHNMTFVNSGYVSGKRYQVDSNGVLLTVGGVSYLPGSTAGSVSSQGQYI